MPRWSAVIFQDVSSHLLKELRNLHDFIVVIMFRVIFIVVWVIYSLLTSPHYDKNFSERTFIETIWAVIPFILLIILAIPSVEVLYEMEYHPRPFWTYKIIAHQWYWCYAVPAFKTCVVFAKRWLSYDSNIVKSVKSPRMLSCNKHLVLPLEKTRRLLITARDVIHSFSIPSMGLKVDAVPGRVNQIFVNPNRLGYFFGQCSEICGSYHSFMPIIVKVYRVNCMGNYGTYLVLDRFIEETSFL